jgi:hypothetical protein
MGAANGARVLPGFKVDPMRVFVSGQTVSWHEIRLYPLVSIMSNAELNSL